jgi:hypothetical protein
MLCDAGPGPREGRGQVGLARRANAGRTGVLQGSLGPRSRTCDLGPGITRVRWSYQRFSTAGPTRTSTDCFADSGRGETDGGHGLTFGKVTMTIPDDQWMSTPLLRRSARSAARDARQVGHPEFGLIVFLALAAMLSVIWLAIRGPVLLERISSWRPICALVSCETEAQPHGEAQAQLEPNSEPPQPQALSQPQAPRQPQPQPPRHLPRPRPHMLDGAVAGQSPPLTYWAYYSPRLSEPPRRSLIECWRDRSTRGPCFERRSLIECWRDRSMRGPCFD